MGDTAAQLEFCMMDWLLTENNAYAELLSERNRHIAELEAEIQQLVESNARLIAHNARLISNERVIYDLDGNPTLFERNADGVFIEVVDLTHERNVRRRLTYEELDNDWFNEMMGV